MGRKAEIKIYTFHPVLPVLKVTDLLFHFGIYGL